MGHINHQTKGNQLTLNEIDILKTMNIAYIKNDKQTLAKATESSKQPEVFYQGINQLLELGAHDQIVNVVKNRPVGVRAQLLQYYVETQNFLYASVIASMGNGIKIPYKN